MSVTAARVQVHGSNGRILSEPMVCLCYIFAELVLTIHDGMRWRVATELGVLALPMGGPGCSETGCCGPNVQLDSVCRTFLSIELG
jgi:hypothetical protein